MRKSPRMIVILSPSCLPSDQARAEYHFALETGEKIVPVFFLDSTLPFTCVFFSEWNSAPTTLAG